MGTDLAPSPVAHRVTRVLLAALRLGAIYAAGVTAILLAVIAVVNAGAVPMLEFVKVVSIPTAALMLLAFVALAVARGIAFLVLWGLALFAWILLLRLPPVHGWLASAFALWTILAAPLAAMVAIGQPAPVSVSRMSKLARRSITIAWIALFGLAIVSEMAVGAYVSLGPLPEWLSTLVHPLWIATPFVIGVHGMVRAVALLRAHKTETA